MAAAGAGLAFRRAAAAAVALLGLLPVANWIAGGHASPTFPAEAGGWLSGTAIVAGLGLVAALASRRVPGLWHDGALRGVLERADPAGRTALLLGGAVALALYLTLARTVFDGRPLLIDEVVQVLQARSYAAGRLFQPADADPAFRSIMHMVEHEGRVFGHFPLGGPAWLLPGELVGAPWIMVPLAGALAVVAWGLVLRRVEARPAVRAGAFLLFIGAPFPAFMAASHMNHTTALMWLLFWAAALLRLAEPPRRAGLALAAGFALGMAAITRPAEAVAFGAAGALWLGWRASRDPRAWVLPAAALALGALVPVAAGAWVNLQTTGGLLRSGYELLWGPQVGLGFHEAPWGPPHTPARGLELASLYLFRLNTYLLEAPFPALLPGLAALAFAPRLERGDRLLLGAAALVLALYFAYWFDGFYLGPRFMHSLAPVALLWTARLPALVRERFGAGLGLRSIGYGGVVAAALAVGVSLPIRAQQYRNGMFQMRWDVDAAAEAAGVRDALVLVHESWGAQVLARLWALGVTRPESERLYRNVDICALHGGVRALEEGGQPPGGAFAALAPLMADSARLATMAQVPDTTARVLPGSHYGPECVERVRADLGGIAVLPPLLLSRRRDLVFARDLGPRNRVLLDRYPDRPVYLVRRPPGAELPRIEPVTRDAVLALGARPASP